MNQQFYTYLHTKPDGTIFYIGKGQAKRAYDLVKRNIHWLRVVNKHGKPNVEILAYWDTEQEALDHEVLLISCFRDMGYVLANLTDGGEGSSGFKHSQESIEKIAKIKRDNPTNYWLGKTRSEETKQKISAARQKQIIPLGALKGVIEATEIKTGRIIILNGAKSITKNNFCAQHVYKCVMGKRKTHKGFTFKRITK